ncbi:MAG: chromosome segregation protein SMC [Fimbriimonadaceae bacterium]|nr:chromosome segregation protein SMC [Fimbriimonadaceae bacterium]
MRLKRVRIVGFKTFADRTEFELNAPLSAIIGPNGCGKSNVVDAILWGLGETNSRHIRAQTGIEVIFAGSRARKPVGYAEVTLFFDNEDGVLPIEAVEVSIQRRLTRGGDSSFAINGRSCRLRDVADLLADTGLGKAGYAIVSQSEIDQALAASPEQRRDWIDEAAGVQRYRARRNEAQRRLGHARTQLERVNDVLLELEVQREPLEEEARVAKAYKSLAARLQELEADLLIRDLGESEADLERHSAAIAAAKEASEKAEADALVAETRLVDLAVKIEDLESEIEQITAELAEAERNAERARADAQVALGKLEGLADIESNLEQEGTRAEEAADNAAAELATATKEESAAQQRLRDLKAELSKVDSEAVALNERLKTAEADLAQVRAARTAWERAEAEAGARAARMVRVAEELEGIVAALPELEEGLAEATKNLDAIESQVAKLTAEREAARQARFTAEEAERTAGAERQRIQEQMSALIGRRRGLEATLESYEGVAQGSKAVLMAARSRELSAEYIPVGEAIETDTELATAIETALGASVNDLIVEQERDAKTAIQMLKDKRLGRATFQPISLMRPFHPSDELLRLAKSDGVRGRASDLVRCLPEHRSVVESLLGRVLVVETLERALALARTSGWSRLVTLDGEVVFAGGAVSGGRTARTNVGVVQRRAELSDLEHEIASFEKQLAALTRENGNEALRAESAETAERLRAEIASLQLERDEARTWKQRLEAERNAAVREQDRLKKEQAELVEVATQNREAPDPEPLEAKRDEALALVAAHSADAQSASARLQDAEREASDAQRRRIEAERRVARLEEAETYRNSRQTTLGPERERWTEARIDAESRQAEFTKQTEVLGARRSEAREQRHMLLAQRTESERDRSLAMASLTAQSEAIRRAEVDWARADSRRANVVERLLQDYGMSVDEARERVGTVHLPPEALREVASLRREVRAMGEVNVGAIDAYDRLSERFNELDGQKQDVEQSIADIEGAMVELDRLTKTKFRDAFTLVQGAFADQFRLLFPGGEAELELTDPENALESGVEIQVTLPGKRRQRLDLLSGGERALSAIAFLFALLQVRPTPLVILDEVDAPLDGRNVERFIERLKGMGETTQFVLITHNPVTIAAADLWYGVTMQEPGVSTIIPVRVPDPEIVKEVVPEAYLQTESAYLS